VALSKTLILASVKGPSGGYRLARQAKAISLLDIIEAVEGPLRGTPVRQPLDRLDERLLATFEDATDQVRRQLAAVTVADLIAARRK
jgi:DNA-binding IscR family transcriptional regulator